MGTVAPTEDKQALADELRRARTLIGQGDGEAALDALVRARDRASHLRDVRALGEILDTARTVGSHGPHGTAVADRADALAVRVAWDLDPDRVERGRRPPPQNPIPLVAWVLGAAFIGLIIWIFYWLQARPIIGGNCGPEGFLGREGILKGGGYESTSAAAVVGGAVLAVVAVAAWRLKQRRGWLLLGFAGLYVIALIVLWYGVSPLVWGDPHCVL
jgi:hypothetical protein